MVHILPLGDSPGAVTSALAYVKKNLMKKTKWLKKLGNSKKVSNKGI